MDEKTFNNHGMKHLKTYHLFESLDEMALPAGMKLYHGSHNEDKGKQITKDGVLKPGNPDIKRGKKLTPQLGMTYLAPELKEAVIYCVGGNYLGSDIDELWRREGRYGYLFVVDSEDLKGKKIYADEDYIGQAIYHLTKNEFYDTGFSSNLKNFDDSKKSFLLERAKTLLTPLQYDKVIRYDDYADFAIAGKKLMKMLPDNIHQALVECGSPCAVEGEVRISESWIFDKTLNPQLKKDASNFFELAKKA
jgi:hypothetical protein